MWEYTDTVREHFLKPRNAGELADANAIGEVGSLACGDALKLFLKINDKGIIEDASFQTFGCASAIASSSALTEMIKGKTVEEAAKVTNKDIATYLVDCPVKRCIAPLWTGSLEAALRNWRLNPPRSSMSMKANCLQVFCRLMFRFAGHWENNLKTVEEVTTTPRLAVVAENALIPFRIFLMRNWGSRS
ncbi:MAG: iron-sulfur cluster assembly scaffold protein [Bilophila wadsworthia]